MGKSESADYNIRQVIELTGTSEFTLRGWETRYNALQPDRSKTGRRLYSKNDILKVRLLTELLKLGHRIGKIAHLNVSGLEKLLANSISSSSVLTEENNQKPKALDLILSSAGKFEWNEIRKIISKYQQKYKAPQFIHNFLLPLIGEVNHRVSADQFSIAQEHIMTALLKESLYGIIGQKKRISGKAPRLVLATPEGDLHEIGLLIASALFSTNGINHLYLGPNVPAMDLCETCLRYNATHVLISSTISTAHGAKDDLFKFIHFLDHNLEPRIKILLGGRNAMKHSIKLDRKHQLLTSFAELVSALKS